jgi:uncharacterized protein YciI
MLYVLSLRYIVLTDVVVPHTPDHISYLEKHRPRGVLLLSGRIVLGELVRSRGPETDWGR